MVFMQAGSSLSLHLAVALGLMHLDRLSEAEELLQQAHAMADPRDLSISNIHSAALIQVATL